MRAGKLPAQQDGYLLQGTESFQDYVERVKSGAPPSSAASATMCFPLVRCRDAVVFTTIVVWSFRRRSGGSAPTATKCSDVEDVDLDNNIFDVVVVVVVVVVVDRSPHEQTLVARTSSTYSLSLCYFVHVLLHPLYDAHALYHVRTNNTSGFLFLKYR